MGLLDSLFRRKPTQDQFARLFIDAVRQRGYTGALDYKADEFRLLHGEGSYFNLHNAYNAYCEARSGQRRGALQGYVSTLLTSDQARPASLAEARPLLRPVIRARAMIEAIRMHHLRTDGNDTDFRPALRPFGDDCVVLLALDHPESIATLTNGPDADWGLSFEQSLAIAIDNLRDSADHFVEVAPGVHGGAWEDGYDISRAAAGHAGTRRGPRASGVHDAHAGSVAGQRRQRRRRPVEDDGTEPAGGVPRPPGVAIHVPLWRNRRRTLPAAPGAHHPPAGAPGASAGAGRLRRAEGSAGPPARGTGHRCVRRHLQSVHAERRFRHVVLAGDLDARRGHLLPKVDRLALVRPEANDDIGEVRVVSWEQAAPVLAPLLEPEDLYPARYRTRGFPSDAQLAQLPEAD
ncbi:hypothetical protein WJ971_16810 [Achromobacter xylosoxidans]